MFQSPRISPPATVVQLPAAHFSSPASRVSIVGAKTRRIGEGLSQGGTRIVSVPSTVSGELIRSSTDAHDRDESQYTTVVSFPIDWEIRNVPISIQKGTPLILFPNSSPALKKPKRFFKACTPSIGTKEDGNPVCAITTESITVKKKGIMYVACAVEHMTEIMCPPKQPQVAGTAVYIGMKTTNGNVFAHVEYGAQAARKSIKDHNFDVLRFGTLVVPHTCGSAGVGARIVLSALPNILTHISIGEIGEGHAEAEVAEEPVEGGGKEGEAVKGIEL